MNSLSSWLMHSINCCRRQLQNASVAYFDTYALAVSLTIILA
ncbi:hypothetical protein L293_2967 [Acinetobacter gyllenbergii CIP 110306 = MTCC 11365]|nr:hypothetical protein L293_2967 [Acinetobacter gyllenbergii CIP 110306 = MTCC 11365]